ncbi:MAG: hypothetical protein V4515_02170 [Chloroflexota bacterium]
MRHLPGLVFPSAAAATALVILPAVVLSRAARYLSLPGAIEVAG